MSWQIKGWLLLTSALLATALVASTARPGSVPPQDAASLARPCSTATAGRQPQVVTRITKPSLSWYYSGYPVV